MNVGSFFLASSRDFFSAALYWEAGRDPSPGFFSLRYSSSLRRALLMALYQLPVFGVAAPGPVAGYDLAGLVALLKVPGQPRPARLARQELFTLLRPSC